MLGSECKGVRDRLKDGPSQWVISSKSEDEEQNELSYLATMLQCVESLVQIDSSIVAFHIARDQGKNAAHCVVFRANCCSWYWVSCCGIEERCEKRRLLGEEKGSSRKREF